MPNLSLGTIEVLGLPAAVEAADVALKTADVKLIGYETTDGMGMVAVKIEGQVSAVQSAVAAACAAASGVSKVFATSVIARPSDQLAPVVLTDETVGLAEPKPAAPKPPAEPASPTTPQAPAEPQALATPQASAEPVEAAAAPAAVAEPAPAAEPVEAPEAPVEMPSKPRTPRTRKPASK